MKRNQAIVGLLLAMASVSGHAVLPPECGSLENAYGPYDYTNYEDFTQRLNIVEINHFTQDVFNLKHAGPRYEQSPPGGGIDYTLRTFPNHHRALDALARLAIRDKTRRPADMHLDVDCYFLRALEFAPKDPMVPMVYGTYLYRTQQFKEALEWYQRAEALGPPSAELYYNFGLVYVKLNDLDKARGFSAKAYELGYPLPWLRNYLNEQDKNNRKKPDAPKQTR